MYPLPRKSLLYYGFMALPLAFAGVPLYMHMPTFYSGTFAIDIGILGVVLLSIRMFDAVQDPFIGYICDKHYRHRLAIMMGGIVALVLGLGGLSAGPIAPISAIVWFAVCMILATTGFSIASVNLNTIGGLWQTQQAEYTRISAWREAFGLLGLILASILPTVLQRYFVINTAFVVSFIAFVGLVAWAVVWFVRLMGTLSHPPRPMSQTVQLRHILRIFDRSNRVFFTICLLSYISASLPAVLVLLFIEYHLNAVAFAGVFLLLYFVAGAAFMGAWIKISQRYGAVATWQYAMILSVVTFFSAVFLQPGDVVFYGLVCIASGVALGADIALPPAIIAHRINRSNSQSQATQYYAVLAFLSKMALAIAAGVGFVMLDATGFRANTPLADSTAVVLLALYAAIPCGIRIVAVIAIWIFKKQETYYDAYREKHV